MGRSCRPLVIVLKALIVAVVATMAWPFLDSYLDPFDDQPFDTAAWAAGDDNEKLRGPMARAAARLIPPGTTAERVRELLGESIVVPPAGDRWGMRPRETVTWEYWLGCWSGLVPYGWDSASLYVHFGADGRVVTTEITGG